jgi:hypothetical protein
VVKTVVAYCNTLSQHLRGETERSNEKYYSGQMCSVEIRTEQLLEFGRKNDEVTAEWRRLHNEELYDT